MSDVNISKQEGGGCDYITKRVQKATTSFMKIKHRWKSNIYTLRIKLNLFNTVVTLVLLNGCEKRKVNKNWQQKTGRPPNTAVSKELKKFYIQKYLQTNFGKITKEKRKSREKKMELDRAHGKKEWKLPMSDSTTL